MNTPFLLEISDFNNYFHKTNFASGSWSHGRKSFEISIQMIDGKFDLRMRVIKNYYIGFPAKQRIYPVQTIEQGIEIFNSII